MRQRSTGGDGRGRQAALRRLLHAHEHNSQLCWRCGIRFKEYWADIKEKDRLADVPSDPFGVPSALDWRLPMCRSSAPLCEGFRAIVIMRFGSEEAHEIMLDVPILLIN